MTLHLGAAWYPEHWPEERWPEDVKLMRDAGLTVARVAEFAWSDLEPREGAFSLGWLERAVKLAADAGLAVVIGTPTAAPPAWLTHKYPDTLAVGEDGRRASHGARCHFDVTSERYLHFCRRIAEKLAVCFGHDARVIGWQIDNEYNTISYSDNARAQFQQWLREMYGTLDKLNDAWATSYWSEKYTDWAQIPLPAGTQGYNAHNPGLRLKWKQFGTECYRRYQRNQVEVIRANTVDQWITHNFMGFFNGFDHYTISADLDFASWDQYFPVAPMDFGNAGAGHDLTRGFKRKNFWLMETQPGHVNWSPVNRDHDREETRAVAWNAVAHGADAVLYWQWRNALNGQEQYHGSLLAPDGNPRPVFGEIAKVGQEFARLGELLEGTTVDAQVALLHSYDDRWALDFQKHNAGFDWMKYFDGFYRPLAERNVAMDVLSTRANLDGFKLVMAAPHLISEQIAGELTRFVEAGGHLVLGARSGMKDNDNALWPQRQPALLQALAGAHVDEYYSLPAPIPISLSPLGETSLREEGRAEGRGEGRKRAKAPAGTASIWAEWLIPHEGTQVLATYGECNGYLDGQAAVTMKQHESGGRVYMIGAWLDSATQNTLLERIVADAGVSPVLAGLPAGVHVMRRGDVHILINNAEPKTVTLPWKAKNALSGKAGKTLALGKWDVAVLTKA
jgi:beta-galactosidase